MTAPSTEETLRAAAETFHKIVASHAARKLLERDVHKLPRALYEDLINRCLDPSEIEKIAADGFEICVRALVALGAEDAAVHECGERDLEEWGQP